MIIGGISAIVIGLTLGILGGGGSILTVPVFVYLLAMDTKLSIALSLGVVGITSLVGSIQHFRNGNIDLKVAALFAPFSMAGTYAGAKIASHIPGHLQLIFFAIIMLAASIYMLKPAKPSTDTSLSSTVRNVLIAAEGIVVGIVTGIVGVGGGFLIVPALVLLTKTPMKKAIGTSLIIIALKSMSGFYGYLDQVTVPWGFFFQFSAFTIVGILAGAYLVKFISQEGLKKGFAIFLIIMGLFILYKNRKTFESAMSLKDTPVVELVAANTKTDGRI